jgi:hypothetical protein
VSATFYAGPDGHGQVELAVDDPGHGYLHVRVLYSGHEGATVAGARMAEMLSDITAAVLGNETSAWVRGLGLLSGAQCRALLPQAQKAVTLAAAGTDRYDRIFVDDDSSAPTLQLCVDCNEGSGFSDQVTISSRCIEFGHHPFGAGPSAQWTGA